eukprot:UN05429
MPEYLRTRTVECKDTANDRPAFYSDCDPTVEPDVAEMCPAGNPCPDYQWIIGDWDWDLCPTDCGYTEFPRVRSVECHDIANNMDAEDSDCMITNPMKPTDSEMCPETEPCGFCINAAKGGTCDDARFEVSGMGKTMCDNRGFTWCEPVVDRDCHGTFTECSIECEKEWLEWVPKSGNGLDCPINDGCAPGEGECPGCLAYVYR